MEHAAGYTSADAHGEQANCPLQTGRLLLMGYPCAALLALHASRRTDSLPASTLTSCSASPAAALRPKILPMIAACIQVEIHAEQRGYFGMFAVHPQAQKQGFARLLI